MSDACSPGRTLPSNPGVFPLTITLAGPPRGKGRGRATIMHGHARARVYPDGKTVKYESQLRYAAQQVMAGELPTALPVRVLVEVTLEIAASWSQKKQRAAMAGELLPTGRGSGDSDNFLKVLDALNGIVFVDDCQIVDARVVKRYGAAPGMVITVGTIGAGGPLFSGAPT